MSATSTTDVFCIGKRAFRSYEAAAKAASKTAKHGTRCEPYRCTACGLYHYGQTHRKMPDRRKRIK